MGSSRRQLHRRGTLGALAFATALAGCDNEGGFAITARPPIAYIRFVHAVPDTGATDWRFIDQLENSPATFGIVFRSFTPYQATAPGTRRLRVFPTSTAITVTSQFLIDTLLTFEAGRHYTIAHVGLSRASQSPKHRIVVYTDDFPALTDPTVALRWIHLGTGIGNTDTFVSDTGASVPLPATPLFTSVAYLAQGTYATRTAAPLTIRATSEGTRTPLIAAGSAPPGQPGDPALNLTAIGGSAMPRSVITALLLPRSVAGSAAPQSAAFTSPAITYLIDRHPR